MSAITIILAWLLVNLWISLICLIATRDMISEYDELFAIFLSSIFTYPITLLFCEFVRYLKRRKKKRPKCK